MTIAGNVPALLLLARAPPLAQGACHCADSVRLGGRVAAAVGRLGALALASMGGGAGPEPALIGWRVGRGGRQQLQGGANFTPRSSHLGQGRNMSPARQ